MHKKSLRSFLRVCVLSAVLCLAVLGLPRAVEAQSFTQSFSYTGGYQSFVVPVGVTSLTVKLWGAGSGSAGGSGAFVTGNLAVTPGTSLTMLVGGGGTFGVSRPSTFGGGGGTDGPGSSGGGRSAIRLSTNNAVISDELVTAAGGAGARVSSAPGGGGGLSTGQNGVDFLSDGGGGGGATQTSGGARGNYFNSSFGNAGSQFQGGNASSQGGGGGGGGGYFGGGGGVANGGGGGGSSYFSNPAFTYNSAASQAGALGSANGVLPGGANDLAYLAGIAVGGGAGSPGGNGYILISYTVTPEPGSLAFLALGSTLILIKRRKAVHA